MDQPEDVEVILTDDRRYHFHSSVLARNSSLLASLLTEQTAAKLGPKAKTAGVKIRWMIELKKNPHDVDLTGRAWLELVPLDRNGTPNFHPYGIVINENGRTPTTLFANYESIFYAFYNRDLPISDDDMPSALTHVLEILDIAEYLGCIPVISKSIDISLLKHGQALYRSIQKMPWGWLGLAMRLKSDVIFQESVVHLAGNWRKIKEDADAMARMNEMPESVTALCEHLHKGLVTRGKKLELALSSLYPGSMAVPFQNLPIRREEYAKDILVWLALSFFRHWLTQSIILEKGCHAADSGYKLYSQLGQAGDAYMDRQVISQFHSKFPMTKKAMNVLENHLLEIKECIRGVVAEHGILESTCLLDTRRFPVDYMTCVEVKKEDIPWVGRKGSANTRKRRLGLEPRRNESSAAAAEYQSEQDEVVEQCEEEAAADEDEDDLAPEADRERGKRARHA
ncbi:hypothetical protein M011DRAFT_525878 [Sporormia fimetaria CBS 119925]|uniref:BTB domain-containing protein n=1 Tax=Sporormia fimetaria CBS 119925 TaxID=1340428 RepID=A0A6A6VC76_9PLEO|nr:hypothetical protein M011DRAFT_525878 [Sporormia fimetaria CBS 119925]